MRNVTYYVAQSTYPVGTAHTNFAELSAKFIIVILCVFIVHLYMLPNGFKDRKHDTHT